METLTVKKVEENYTYMMSMCGIYGMIFTFCLYQNLSGITFPVCVAATIFTTVLFMKRMGITIQRNFLIYVMAMLLLGVSTTMTSSGFFHVFNWAGILLLLMTAVIRQVNPGGNLNFQQYLVNILVLTGKTVISVLDPLLHGIQYNQDREKEKSKYIKPVITGLLIAACLLVVVLPLLIFSDQIFASFFGGFIHIFKFGEAWGLFFTFLAGFVLIYAFLSGISRLEFKSQEGGNFKGKEGNINPVTGVTFAGIFAAIYVFYSVIQILFLFMRLESGLPDGVTYSQYAHAGFWQLLLVSLINIVTVLVCISVFQENKILKTLLMVISVCTCIMTLSAAYRMVLYVNAYYLTFLRVLVLWFLGVLMLIMFGIMWSIIRRNFQLFRYIMVIVTVCYIGLSFSKVDRRVAEYNVEHWDYITSDDMAYLIYSSSWDAAPVLAEAEKKAAKDQPWQEQYWKDGVEEYYRMILDQKMTLRSWNFARAEAKDAAREYLHLLDTDD